jgi:hypothetical protein
MLKVEDVVSETVQEFIRDGVLFTALDVSNKVKDSLPLARHREVRDLVRAAFTTEIEPAGYARTPISVTLADGSTTEALLYHPLADSWDLDNKYGAQQRSAAAVRPVQAAQTVVGSTSTTTVVSPSTIPAPPASVAPVTIPAPAGNARALWDAMFKSTPSLFPLR